jgi:hypothetical protein
MKFSIDKPQSRRTAIQTFGALTTAALLAPASQAQNPHSMRNNHKRARVILAFNTMVGVDGALVGSDAIRGVAGDELPWEVGSASGFLTTGGHLHISVRGLVFPEDDPSVPQELRGINDESEFRALVSVVGEDGAINNLVTDPFPATRSGDSEINAKLELPSYSFAPIIFILAGSEDKWFAVTGFEAEGDEE